MSRSYTKEFREEAVKLAISSPCVSSVAKDLGLPASTLHSWVDRLKKKDKSSTTRQGSEDSAQLLEEIKVLKRKLARVEQEKAILKKAATYFAKELE